MLLSLVFEDDQRFQKRHRITKRSEFQTVYQQGSKHHSLSFVLYYLPNGMAHHRLGLTVSRKIGCAVKRNRVKRRFREVFRKNRPAAAVHYDLVMNAKKCASTAESLELENEYRRALAVVFAAP